jgi:lysophospholipase L1-like esterase
MVAQRLDMDWFLLFGDSITQQSFSQERGFAFGAALSDAYARRLDIINRGLSGYNTRQALDVLPIVVPKRSQASVRLLTIWFGANDARLPDTPGAPQQHVPLDEFMENIRAMATHPDVRGHEGVRMVLITPPPVDERKCILNEPDGVQSSNRRAAVTKEYAQGVVSVGKELHVPVLDIWSIMIQRAGGSPTDPEPTGSIDMPANETLQEFLHDGLHLSPSGYRIVYDELMALIARTWPDQIPDALPFVLPRWDDMGVWQRS